MPHHSPIVAARFWSKVDVRKITSCWNWRGAKSKGYGSFKLEGSAIQAPRIAWELATGESMPVEMFACHTCDNPACCNPYHIYAGSRIDNARDAVQRGRLGYADRKGGKNGNAKLNEDQVREIKSRIAAGETNMSIAKDYPVKHQMISKIRSGEFWEWVV